MTKKEAILKILERVEPYWDKAQSWMDYVNGDNPVYLY